MSSESLAPAVVATIVIPGIAGSTLNDPMDGSELWLGPRVFLPGFGSVRDRIRDPTYGLTATEPLPHYYGRVRQFILAQPEQYYWVVASGAIGGTRPYLYYEYPYDWRQDLLNTADNLKLFLDGVANGDGATEINIVAHSMGGLLARTYLWKNQADPVAAKVKRLIMVGTPNLGAAKAYPVLLAGDGFIFTNFLMKGLPPYMQMLTRDCPAVYELLPCQTYFDTITGPVVVFGAYHFLTWQESYLSGPDGGKPGLGNALYQLYVLPRADLVKNAAAFHANLDQWSWPITAGSTQRLFALYGNGESTIMSTNVTQNYGNLTLNTASLGDGTVPAESVLGAPNIHKSWEFRSRKGGGPVDHNGLMENTDVLQTIMDCVRGNYD